MEILQLKPEQLTRKILHILKQLSDTDKLSLGEARLLIARQIKNNHFTYVGYIEGEPIAIGSLLIMEHLIHNGSKSGLIEDVAVKKDMHGQGYGKVMVNHLVKQARKLKCYKATLDCDDFNLTFYLKCGFQRYANQMRMNLLETG